MYKAKNLTPEQVNFFNAKFLTEGCERAWGKAPAHIYYTVESLPEYNSKQFPNAWESDGTLFMLVGKQIRKCYLSYGGNIIPKFWARN